MFLKLLSLRDQKCMPNSKTLPHLLAPKVSPVLSNKNTILSERPHILYVTSFMISGPRNDPPIT